MSQPPKSTPAQRGMAEIKIYVPAATGDALRRQAQGLGISVTSHLSPVLQAVGAGRLAARHEYASVPAPAPAPAPISIRERLGAANRLSGACRAVLVAVCEDFEQAGQRCVVETNRELGARLQLSVRAVSQAVGLLEAAGWLHVKQFASGANGRQLWPTSKARGLYTP